MADVEQIRVEILATAAQFRAELDSAVKKLSGPGGLKESIKDVPNKVEVDFQMATAGAHTKLGKLTAAIRETKAQIERDASFGLDTGVARLKLDALDRKAEAVKRKIAEDAALSAIGDGGGGVGGALSSLPASIGPISPGSIAGVAAIAPMAFAAVGALTALVGSLGAAALGLGALTVAAAGVASVGFGPMIGVLIPAIKGITDVKKATDKLAEAQEKYGSGSKQAQQAQHDLNSAIAEAGPGAAEASKAISDLGKAWAELSKPAQGAFFKILTAGIGVLQQLLPTFAHIAKTSFDAIGKGLDPIFKGLSSPAFKHDLELLGSAFSKIAPSTIEGFANIFHALMNIAIAAAPFLEKAARAFRDMTADWVRGTGHGNALRGVIGGLISHLESWWGLLKAIGGLLGTIFSAGASSGKSMVDSLTNIVEKWNAWLNTKQGQKDLKQFFTDAKNLVKQLLETFGPLVQSFGELAIALIPVATWLLKATKEIFVTDNIGKAFDATVKALGGALEWLVTSPLALLLPGIGMLVGVIKLWKLATELAGESWKSIWHGVQVAFASVLRFLLGGFSSLLGAIASTLEAADKADFAGIFGDKFSKAAKAVHGGQKAIDDFRKTLDPAAVDSQTQTTKIAEAHEASMKRVQTAWGEGVEATKKGISEISKETLAELKILAPAATGEAGSTIKKLTGGLPHLAGGGIIGNVGERGRDEVPIVVGRGEAILHGGHQAIVNDALANAGMRGGLAEMFKSTGGLHYNMAAGGFAGGGFTPAIASAEVMGGLGYHSNPIQSRGYSELAVPASVANAGSALGHLPYRTAMRIKAGRREVVAAKQDIGAGSSFNPVMGLYPQTRAELGLAGGEFHVEIERADGAALSAGAAAAGGGKAVVKIKVPKWTGPGGQIGGIGKGALAQVTGAANKMLEGFAPEASPGGGGGGSVGPAGGPKGLGTFDGLQVADWIIPELEYARKHGWAGHITSGYRSPTQVVTGPVVAPQGQSEHQGTQYPHGAVDFGGPSDGANAEAFRRAAAGYKGRRLLSPQGFVDLGHMSGTGHAAGGFAGFAAGGFAGAGATPKKAKAPRPPKKAQHPPNAKRPANPKHPKSPAARVIKRSAVLPADILKAGLKIHGDEVTAEGLATQYSHLLDTQALTPTEPLATLSDADVAFMDPGGHVDSKGVFVPGPKGYISGDELVNANGMTTGRFFGPGGISGGKFVAGIDTRQSQIGELLGVLGKPEGAFGDEATSDSEMVQREQTGIVKRKDREKRIKAYLVKQVSRANHVKTELDNLKKGDLKRNLKDAVSKQAIAGRTSNLRKHLADLTSEHAAEVKHQGELIPLDKEKGFTESLTAQMHATSAAIAAEASLSSRHGNATAVEHAQEAILKDNLKTQLAEIGADNTRLGGSSSSVGTGGLIGQIAGQVTAMRTDQDTHNEDLRKLPNLRYEVGQEVASLLREQTALNETSSIQVRNPEVKNSVAEEPNTQLLELVKQQLAISQHALAISQSQFAVFAGFEPLFQARMVGTFAHGVDRVPRTGPAMVHQGEVILPDPDGPYGNRAAAQVSGANAQPMQITLVMANNDHALMRVVDARVDQRSLRVVSDKSGQRSRLIAGVTTLPG